MGVSGTNFHRITPYRTFHRLLVNEGMLNLLSPFPTHDGDLGLKLFGVTGRVRAAIM
jgi:hypothetical protein